MATLLRSSVAKISGSLDELMLLAQVAEAVDEVQHGHAAAAAGGGAGGKGGGASSPVSEHNLSPLLLPLSEGRAEALLLTACLNYLLPFQDPCKQQEKRWDMQAVQVLLLMMLHCAVRHHLQALSCPEIKARGICKLPLADKQGRAAPSARLARGGIGAAASEDSLRPGGAGEGVGTAEGDMGQACRDYGGYRPVLGTQRW
jgi:hypothetical protein